MYGYPAPYYSPYAAPPKSRTPDGLRWSAVGLGLGMGYFVAQLVVALILFALFPALIPGNSSDFFALVGILVLSAIMLVILGILVLVFYWIGVGFMYGGRNEFGPAHARNVRIALVMVLIATSLGLANAIATFIVGSTVIRFTGPGIELDVGRLYTVVLVNIVMGILISAFGAAHLALSIRAIAKPNHQLLVNGAAALGTATPGIAGALVLLQLPRYVAQLQAFLEGGQGGFFFSSPPITPDLGVPAVVGAVLSLVVTILFLIAFRGASWRISTGELKPLIPPAGAPGAWSPTAGPYAVVPPPPQAPAGPAP